MIESPKAFLNETGTSASAAPRIIARARLPLRGYDLVPEIVAFSGLSESGESMALVFPGSAERPLVRIHSACITGDVFGSEKCDCGAQLREAIERCSACGGAILYLDQEGRGIGLTRKIEAYALQQLHGVDTYAANRALGLPDDLRTYDAAAEMLRLLGKTRITLLTGSPHKLDALRACGIDAIGEASSTFVTAHNVAYLRAKKKAGHHLLLDLGELA